VTPREYLDIARERWRFILAGLLLGLLAAGLLSYFLPRQYAATVTVMVTAQASADPAAAADSVEISSQRIHTYVELMRSRRLAGDVIAALGLAATPEQLAERITVSSAPDSVLLTAAVTDGSPDQAIRIANSAAEQFIRNVAEIEQPTDPARPPLVIGQVFEAAEPPAELVAPRPLLYLVLGASFGLALGLVTALLRHSLDSTVKTRRQLEDALGTPVLGVIGRDAKIVNSPLVIYGDPQAPLAEAFRQLRTNIQFMDVDNAHKVILVTSPSQSEGKSTTVCNLGLALAEAGTSVLILDADLRRPSVARCLGVDGTIGLTNVLVNRVRIERAVLPLAPALDVLPSGLMPPNPSELLGSDRMVNLLAELRRSYDVILVDTSPLLPVTDAAVLAPRADGVLIMVRYGKTRIQDLQAAKDSLGAVSGRILGSVLTMAPSQGKHHYVGPVSDGWKLPDVPIQIRTAGRREPGPEARVPAPAESPEQLAERSDGQGSR